MKRGLVFGVLFALVLSMAFSSVALNFKADAAQLSDQTGPKFMPNQLIVAFKKDTSNSHISNFYNDHRSDFGLSEGKSISTDQYGRAIKVVKTTASVNSAMIENLKRDPRVDYAEPDYILTIDTISTNDPARTNLWGLDNTGQTIVSSIGTVDDDIDAPEAWSITTGSYGTVVGIIDTGIDYNHEDLVGNLWINPNEIAGNKIDDDNNGYVDDVYGINAIRGTGDPYDDNNHGTHVAGTIGAVANNGKGVVGINHKVSIVACKFLSSSGSGSTSDAVTCFNYFKSLKDKGINIVVTNNSWGGGGYSTTLYNSMNNGILHAVAAGNDGKNIDTYPSYPASYNLSNIITVAATNNKDAYASFSNYGTTSVDIAAPGVNIYSTLPGNTYAYYSGTSMATPHVTGVAALAYSLKPSSSINEVKSSLMQNGDPLAVTGKTGSDKRLNANNVLVALSPVISSTPSFDISTSPSSLALTVGNSGTSTITITPTNGFSSTVALSTTGLTNGISSAFSPNPATTSSILTLNVPSSTLPGNYNIGISATGGSITKTSSIALDVKQPNIVSITTDKTSYAKNSFAYITVNVRDNIGKVSGAQVSVTIKDKNNVSTTGTGTTNSNGDVVFKYKIGTTTGTYTINASATATGHNTGTASKTFTVN